MKIRKQKKYTLKITKNLGKKLPRKLNEKLSGFSRQIK